MSFNPLPDTKYPLPIGMQELLATPMLVPSNAHRFKKTRIGSVPSNKWVITNTTDADGVLYVKNSPKFTLIETMRESGIDINAEKLNQLEKQAAALDQSTNKDKADVNWSNTDVLRKLLEDNGATPEIFKRAAEKHLQNGLLPGVRETYRDVYALTDIASRTDINDPATATATHVNKIISCGIVNLMAHMLQEAPIHSMTGQEFFFSRELKRVGFLGSRYLQGLPVATYNQVFTNPHKAEAAHWLRSFFRLGHPSQEHYIYDGENDNFVVALVDHSQLTWALGNTEAVFELHRVSQKLPKEQVPGRNPDQPREHAKPIPADYSVISSLDDYVEWSQKIDPKDPFKTPLPPDGPMRQSLMVRSAIEARIARECALDPDIRRSDFPLTFGCALAEKVSAHIPVPLPSQAAEITNSLSMSSGEGSTSSAAA